MNWYEGGEMRMVLMWNCRSVFDFNLMNMIVLYMSYWVDEDVVYFVFL